jgi:ribose/xylose/arabinose/galactoside ABC-type transport system permease subunit
MKTTPRLWLAVLKNMPVILFVAIFIGFSLLDQRFFTWVNFENIVLSSSFVGIIAVGMTFVLLTGGIDLSVGPPCTSAGRSSPCCSNKARRCCWRSWLVWWVGHSGAASMLF